jgi:hypothetical protein
LTPARQRIQLENCPVHSLLVYHKQQGVSMIKISQGMMAQLQTSRMDDFVDRAVAFVQNEYPHLAARADSVKIAELVRFAVDRARRYGFVGERDIVKYLSVMISLGPRFDDDPRFEQIRLPLSGMPDTATEVRIEFLITMAEDILRAADGEHQVS